MLLKHWFLLLLGIFSLQVSSAIYCDKLPVDTHCSVLNLTDQSLGDDGLRALIDALLDAKHTAKPGEGNLNHLILQKINITSVGAGHLVRLLTNAANTSSLLDVHNRFDLDVRRNSLGISGIKQLRKMVTSLREKPMVFDVYVTGGGGIAGPGDVQLDFSTLIHSLFGKKQAGTRADCEMVEWRIPSHLRDSRNVPMIAVSITIALVFVVSILSTFLGEVTTSEKKKDETKSQ